MSEKRKNTPRLSAGKIWSGYSFIFIFAAIFIAYYLVNASLTWVGVMNILRHSAVVGIIALGMGLVVITGQIDLSVGSMLAFVGGFAVIVFNTTNSIVLTLLAAMAMGAVCGLINGVHRDAGHDADLPLADALCLP